MGRLQFSKPRNSPQIARLSNKVVLAEQLSVSHLQWHPPSSTYPTDELIFSSSMACLYHGKYIHYSCLRPGSSALETASLVKMSSNWGVPRTELLLEIPLLWSTGLPPTKGLCSPDGMLTLPLTCMVAIVGGIEDVCVVQFTGAIQSLYQFLHKVINREQSLPPGHHTG